jgi:hypothetical protein
VPVLHFAMLAHALALMTLIVAPLVLWDLYASLRSPRKASAALFSTASVVYIVLIGLMAYALVRHSYSHPFLLSDNRFVSYGDVVLSSLLTVLCTYFAQALYILYLEARTW